MNPKVLVFSKIAELYQALTRSWFKIAQDSIKERGWFTAVLSGGKTPRSFYRHLSKYRQNPLWQRTHLFIADERFVSRDDNENNGKMIRGNLIEPVGIPLKNVHFMDTHQRTVSLAAKEYEKTLKDFFGLKERSFPKFDLVLLGVGEDGHTASLFPSAKALKERKRAVVSVVNPAGTQQRISLSPPAIKNARNVFFLVKGKEKAGIIKNILSGQSRGLPAVQVYPRKGDVKFFLDHAAAGKGYL